MSRIRRASVFRETRGQIKESNAAVLPVSGASADCVEDAQRRDMLRYIVDAEQRRTAGGRREIDRHGADQRRLAAIAERAEETLARHTDHDRQSVVGELSKTRQC